MKKQTLNIFNIILCVFLGIIMFPAAYVLSEICFFILPITYLLALGLIGYSVITRNHLKFNKLYAILTIAVITGFTEICYETVLSNTFYFFFDDWLKFALLILCLIAGIFIVLGMYQKKDVRYYFIIYLLIPIILFSIRHLFLT